MQDAPRLEIECFIKVTNTALTRYVCLFVSSCRAEDATRLETEMSSIRVYLEYMYDHVKTTPWPWPVHGLVHDTWCGGGPIYAR